MCSIIGKSRHCPKKLTIFSPGGETEAPKLEQQQTHKYNSVNPDFVRSSAICKSMDAMSEALSGKWNHEDEGAQYYIFIINAEAIVPHCNLLIEKRDTGKGKNTSKIYESI